ncbi:hypothetical protein CFP59_00200 [Streptomyces malaysiensis subsp. malaysiensis]|nr:hypothetical protein CFP59_00200 [Streptomyces sp. M56]
MEGHTDLVGFAYQPGFRPGKANRSDTVRTDQSY